MNGGAADAGGGEFLDGVAGGAAEFFEGEFGAFAETDQEEADGFFAGMQQELLAVGSVELFGVQAAEQGLERDWQCRTFILERIEQHRRDGLRKGGFGEDGDVHGSDYSAGAPGRQRAALRLLFDRLDSTDDGNL